MSEARLSDRFTAMLEVQSVDGFRNGLLRFTRRLGFDLVSAFVVIDRPVGEPEFLAVGNAPEAYLQTNKNGEAGRRDPVMQHCKQAAYGYRTGICFALHLPKGLHFAVGVDRDQVLPSSLAEQYPMAADLCLFAAHAQQAAVRLLVPQSGG